MRFAIMVMCVAMFVVCALIILIVLVHDNPPIY